jgi:hypothetical protein
MAIARDIWAREGIRGINKGVNAVAVRQLTNWGSRIGIARIVESTMRGRQVEEDRGKPLSNGQRILASTLGGALSTWNQPMWVLYALLFVNFRRNLTILMKRTTHREVIRVEMQSQVKDPNRPAKMTIGNVAKYIYSKNGLIGFYRGVTPRIGLGVWQTVGCSSW